MQVPSKVFMVALDKEKKVSNELSEEEKEEDDLETVEQAPIIVSQKEAVADKSSKMVGKIFD